MTVKPRTPAPSLEVETVDGEPWRLSDRRPANFTMIVAYRGQHCPICKTYLKDLRRHVDDFTARGVDVIALSTDSEERARATREEWELAGLTIGYGLPIEQAQAWGLYISSGRGKTSVGIEEPARFNEPGLFLVRPDGTLYAAWTATMPFARPHFREVVAALDVILERNYPARGEL